MVVMKDITTLVNYLRNMEDSRSFREYFLVNIPTAMYLTEDNEIENYLKANKFKCDAPFRGRPWYFVNILNKTYKP